jgi:hypothetical protein
VRKVCRVERAVEAHAEHVEVLAVLRQPFVFERAAVGNNRRVHAQALRVAQHVAHGRGKEQRLAAGDVKLLDARVGERYDHVK